MNGDSFWRQNDVCTRADAFTHSHTRTTYQKIRKNLTQSKGGQNDQVEDRKYDYHQQNRICEFVFVVESNTTAFLLKKNILNLYLLLITGIYIVCLFFIIFRHFICFNYISCVMKLEY